MKFGIRKKNQPVTLQGEPSRQNLHMGL